MDCSLTIFNLKGGTAKSTTCVNVGVIWAERGERVLIVDTDPQGSASKHLGVRVDGEDFRDVLVEQTDIEQAITETDLEGLELLPGGEWLTDVAPATSGQPLRELRLKRALDPIREQYDRIVIDSPASTGLLNTSALLAARHALITVEAQGAAVDGLIQALDLADEIESAREEEFCVIGAMVCMYDARTSLSQETEQALRDNFEELVLETIIHRNVRVAEAYAHGEPVITYAPSSKGANNYREATREIDQRIDDESK